MWSLTEIRFILASALLTNRQRNRRSKIPKAMFDATRPANTCPASCIWADAPITPPRSNGCCGWVRKLVLLYMRLIAEVGYTRLKPENVTHPYTCQVNVRTYIYGAENARK